MNDSWPRPAANRDQAISAPWPLPVQASDVELTLGQSLHAAFTGLDGNILSDARIFCATDFILVDIPEARKEIMLRYFRDGEKSLMAVVSPLPIQ